MRACPPASAVALGLALGVGLAAGLAVPRPAAAAPALEVRARTAVQLDPVVRAYDGVQVTGQVVDRFTGEGVPGASVVVRFGGASTPAHGDGNGRFQATFPVPADPATGDPIGSYDVAVDFHGSQAYETSSTRLDRVDIGKSSLDLTITGEATADAATITVRATAGSDTAGGGLLVLELRVGDAALPADQLGPPRQLRTDARGEATLSLGRAALGGPGRKRAVVRFAGDVAFNPGEAETTFDLTAPTTTSLAIGDTALPFEAALQARGRVVDGAAPGAPSDEGVARAAVVLLIGTRRIAETVAGADGRFAVRVPAEEIGPGRHTVQAVFEPTEAWRSASRSPIVAVDIAAPAPVPVSLTLIAFAATASALVTFLAMRSKPWTRWQRRARTEDGSGPEAARPAPRPGLELARPSLVSTLRRAADSDFTGLCRDAVSHRPIAGVALRLDHPDGSSVTAASAADGSFAFTGLAGGDWSGSAAAAGYCTEHFPVDIPHRGELRGVRLDLIEVRERIFQLYREAAQPLLPGPDLWGIWTPRQIVDHVRARRPAPALAALTDFVEERYFSQRLPDEPLLADARRLVDAAIRERPARAAG